VISKMWRFGIEDAPATIMAKLPLRFLLAVAIPVAVIGQLGFGDHARADTSPEVAGLLAASKEEMAHAGSVESFCAYAQKDWEEYSGTTNVINDYIDLANDGVPGIRPPHPKGTGRSPSSGGAQTALQQRRGRAERADLGACRTS
jgi:hypothetical protein